MQAIHKPNYASLPVCHVSTCRDRLISLVQQIQGYQKKKKIAPFRRKINKFIFLSLLNKMQEKSYFQSIQTFFPITASNRTPHIFQPLTLQCKQSALLARGFQALLGPLLLPVVKSQIMSKCRLCPTRQLIQIPLYVLTFNCQVALNPPSLVSIIAQYRLYTTHLLYHYLSTQIRLSNQKIIVILVLDRKQNHLVALKQG